MTTEDGETVHGLYWPPEPGRPVVLFFHGNAGHVYGWAQIRKELLPLDAGLLIIDYRGYGKSSGKPSEPGLYRDAAAALAWLRSRGVVASDILLFGKSLGGGVATELARGTRFRGLVLESTFTSIQAIIAHLFPVFPVGALFPDRFESLAKLAELRCPLLVIHGTADELIPVSEGRALYAAALDPCSGWFPEGAGHNDVSYVTGREYGRRIRAWMDEAS